MYNNWTSFDIELRNIAVIDELFRMGFDRITARHAVDNPASGRVMEKCGMKYIKNDTTNRKFEIGRIVRGQML